MATYQFNGSRLSNNERVLFHTTGHLSTAEKMLADVNKARQAIIDNGDIERAEDILEFIRELRADVQEITSLPIGVQQHPTIASRLAEDRAVLATMHNSPGRIPSREAMLRTDLRTLKEGPAQEEEQKLTHGMVRAMEGIKFNMTTFNVYFCINFSTESARNKLIQQKLEDGDCDICAEPLQNPCVLPCGHTYCDDCALSWLLGLAAPTCPSCRAPTQVHDNSIQAVRTTECHHGETEAFWLRMHGFISLSKDHKEICWRPSATCKDEAFTHPLDDEGLLSRFTVKAKVVRQASEGDSQGILTSDHKARQLIWQSNDGSSSLIVPIKAINTFFTDPELSNGSTLQLDVGLARFRFKFVSEAPEVEQAVVVACIKYCKSEMEKEKLG